MNGWVQKHDPGHLCTKAGVKIKEQRDKPSQDDSHKGLPADPKSADSRVHVIQEWILLERRAPIGRPVPHQSEEKPVGLRNSRFAIEF